jgi:hypothetical protein
MFEMLLISRASIDILIPESEIDAESSSRSRQDLSSETSRVIKSGTKTAFLPPQAYRNRR